jgi:hypothetical protein
MIFNHYLIIIIIIILLYYYFITRLIFYQATFLFVTPINNLMEKIVLTAIYLLERAKPNSTKLLSHIFRRIIFIATL